MHILVIVGMGEFDELVRHVDGLAGCGHTFVVQTGTGTYRLQDTIYLRNSTRP